jgi:D-alanyl-D-alanine carboxypeptidase
MEEEIVKQESPINRSRLAIIVGAVLFIGILIFGFVKILSLDKRVAVLSRDLASTTATLYGTTNSLSETLSSAKGEIASANNSINAIKDKVGGVEETVGSISGTVSTLQKLSATDPELLKKYSKVYFLNENFTPAHLVQIPQGYVYSNTVPEQFLQESEPFLRSLLVAGRADNVSLYVRSGFRSFGRQQTIKSKYNVIYGEGTANSFSADQGYSEHQLGTAVDFITEGLGGELTENFDTTMAFKWLKDNAHKFGFVLSYPKGNAHYTYEPWHWRFVGVKLATHLHNNNINFYDMDQRDIDSYLVNLFD